MGKDKVSHGGGSLTEDDFAYMAKLWGMSVAETKKNVYALLKKELAKAA